MFRFPNINHDLWCNYIIVLASLPTIATQHTPIYIHQCAGRNILQINSRLTIEAKRRLNDYYGTNKFLVRIKRTGESTEGYREVNFIKSYGERREMRVVCGTFMGFCVRGLWKHSTFWLSCVPRAWRPGCPSSLSDQPWLTSIECLLHNENRSHRQIDRVELIAHESVRELGSLTDEIQL